MNLVQINHLVRMKKITIQAQENRLLIPIIIVKISNIQIITLKILRRNHILQNHEILSMEIKIPGDLFMRIQVIIILLRTIRIEKDRFLR